MKYKVELFLSAFSAGGPFAFRAPTHSRYDAGGMHQRIHYLKEGYDQHLLNTPRL